MQLVQMLVELRRARIPEANGLKLLLLIYFTLDRVNQLLERHLLLSFLLEVLDADYFVVLYVFEVQLPPVMIERYLKLMITHQEAQ